MNEIQSSRWYRFFQKLALGLGAVASVIGIMAHSPAVLSLGLVSIAHGLVASLIIRIEDRRTCH